MIRSYKPFYGRRFAGDTSKMIVHDLLHEQTGKVTTKSCEIDEIKERHIKMFTELDTAVNNGFRPCSICLWTHVKV